MSPCHPHAYRSKSVQDSNRIPVLRENIAQTLVAVRGFIQASAT
jgi:hypothetical protein